MAAWNHCCVLEKHNRNFIISQDTIQVVSGYGILVYLYSKHCAICAQICVSVPNLLCSIMVRSLKESWRWKFCYFFGR